MHMFICLHTHKHTYIRTYMFVYTHVHTYINMYTIVYIRIQKIFSLNFNGIQEFFYLSVYPLLTFFCTFFWSFSFTSCSSLSVLHYLFLPFLPPLNISIFTFFSTYILSFFIFSFCYRLK